MNRSGALSHGLLDAKYREPLALSAIGKMVGLKPQAVEAKRDAGLKFAQSVVITGGEVCNEAVQRVREAGFNDGEITEIVAHVASTEVDFPRAPTVLA